ncbi:MAG: hypothetical protein E2O54_12435 [Gammaproteobacteria bacterium]|nr:MAG: hypothetical protein E2O58_03030 [Gammaproteobacteria bacterium]TDJ38709.1 MAG: hypothetical protein E2O54_12435 [Gammaproteobacteria bacterium]
MPYQKVLVAVDVATESNYIVEKVRKFAGDKPISIVHVLEPAFFYYGLEPGLGTIPMPCCTVPDATCSRYGFKVDAFRMWTKPVQVMVTVLLFCTASVAGAEECVDRTAQALAELQQVFPEMDEVQAGDAKRILDEVCLAPEPAAAQAEASKVRTGSDTPTVFGVQLNKAEPDSKGHARLHKTH